MAPRTYQLHPYRKLLQAAIQETIMQYITQHYLFPKRFQQQQNTTANNKWLRRIVTTGFAFFLIKGLAWIAAAVWVIY